MAGKNESPSPEDLGLIQTTINNEELEKENESSNPQPKKRGRPKGSSNGPKKTTGKRTEDIKGLAKQIEGIHAMLAMMTGFQELVISEAESQMLANGITAVTEEYGLALDGKTGAAIQLFGAAAIVYVPRALVINAKMEQQKAKATDVSDAQFTPSGNDPNNSTSH